MGGGKLAQVIKIILSIKHKMEKIINKYESPEVETIDIKTEGVICSTSSCPFEGGVCVGDIGCSETGR